MDFTFFFFGLKENDYVSCQRTMNYIIE